MRIFRTVFVACIVVTAMADDGARYVNSNQRFEFQFRHQSPLTDQRHTHLTMGSGLGWIDFDCDGRPDLFCAQGQTFNESQQAAVSKWPVAQGQNSGLFRNRSGKLKSLNAACGLTQQGYQTGVTVGDFNNDGMDDLFVSAFGPHQLFENNGDGTFSLVPFVDSSSIRYSASTTFLDADNDGVLDIFVTNYLQLNFADYQVCSADRNGRKFFISCHPRVVDAEPDEFFRNDGAGKFLNRSEPLGLAAVENRQGLGVIAADLDRSGTTDLYVANDSVANHFWNNSLGVFSEEGLLTGTAFNRIGQREAGMGLACADFNGSGQLDLFVTNFQHETNTLYRNEGALLFFDITDEVGLAESSRPRLGFGTNFTDADNDGWPDLFIANGHIHDQLDLMGETGSYRQAALMMKNQNGQRFVDASEASGDYFQKPVLGRGSAVADVDGDGLPDLAVSHLNDDAVILRNETSGAGNYVQVKLVGTTSNRSAIGAIVDAEFGGRLLAIPRLAASSYLSADSDVLTIGLGQEAQAKLTVHWGGGKSESFGTIQAGQSVVLIEGRTTGVTTSWDD